MAASKTGRAGNGRAPRRHAGSGRTADTRERLLAAAESLFMEKGYAATSLREITAHAGANLAAVNYHFGSKEALIREVFERRLGSLNAHRVACLDRLEAAAQGKPLAVEQILEAILAPLLEAGQEPLARGADLLRLLGRAFSEPTGALSGILPAQYRQVVIRFKQAMTRALPEVPDRELTWRMHFMFGTLSYAMAGNDALHLIATCNLDGGDDAAAIVRRLIPFLAAGLRAPLPAVRTSGAQPGLKAA
ncbi:MAG TPA: TetR/AcrR family transcriptional regulator [Burkholderiales bacterium]|nr:TetR/AcrR family transcriptional regulator [Burkholderiales bacterium]